MPQVRPGADHYVLNCARQYAATLQKLWNAADEVERRSHTQMLHYLMESGTCEQDHERRRRATRLPADILDHFERKAILPDGRLISANEAEWVRDMFSIPPFATMECLTGEDMLDLADLYEGWAQDGEQASLDMAQLLGWADGFRILAAAIGSEYKPPPNVPGEPDSLLKFMAKKMIGGRDR
jgi:hypothetical protein